MSQEKSREELTQLLEELRRGLLSSDEVYHTVATFGREHFLEARPDVERLLSCENQEVRSIALNVLALDWKLQKHWKTALDVVEHDPDDDNRLRAATLLGGLKRDTGDHQVLQTLAHVVRNEEDLFVRKAAYLAMQSVLYDRGPRVRLENLQKPFDLEKDVDWELVNLYL